VYAGRGGRYRLRAGRRSWLRSPVVVAERIEIV